MAQHVTGERGHFPPGFFISPRPVRPRYLSHSSPPVNSRPSISMLRAHSRSRLFR